MIKLSHVKSFLPSEPIIQISYIQCFLPSKPVIKPCCITWFLPQELVIKLSHIKWFLSSEPVIKLSDTKYTVKEPMFKEETSTLRVPVIREGDLSETAIVTINTKDGSADAGKDYNGFFKG